MPHELNFDVPQCGAVRDVKELEYISMLHQTDKFVRPEGTITAKDIALLLKSRHGLEVQEEYIECDLMEDLSGDPRYKKRDVLDIPQLVALLFIPKLKVASEVNEAEEPPTSQRTHNVNVDKGEAIYYSSPPVLNTEEVKSNEELTDDIFGPVLDIILKDIRRLTKSESSDDPQIKEEKDEEGEIMLTKDVLRSIFTAYGENFHLCERFLQRMVDYAGGEVALNKATFIRALTQDLGAYKSSWAGPHSTHFEDLVEMVTGEGYIAPICSVTGIVYRNVADFPTKDNNKVAFSDAPDLEENDGMEDYVVMKRLTEQQCASTIDLTADTFYSDAYFIPLLFSFILLIFLYEPYWIPRLQCPNATFGCIVAQRTLDWLTLSLLFGGAGCTLIYLMSAANGAAVDSGLQKKIFALALLVYMNILTYWKPEWAALRRRNDLLPEKIYEGLAILNLIIAFKIAATQLIYIAKDFNISFAGTSFDKASFKRVNEKHTKNSAVYKVDNLFSHAQELHGGVRSALVTYQSRVNEREQTGGVSWALRNFGHFCKHEGLWLSTRMFSSFIAFFLGGVFFVAFLYLAYSTLEDAFQDGNQNSIAGTLYISVEKRSLYFNASGSFLFYPSEVTEEYLASNDLVFGYVFDEDLSVYQQSNEEQFVRELLNTVASYGSISISGSESSSTSLQEELSDRMLNLTGVNLDRILQLAITFRAYEGDVSSFLVGEFRRLTPFDEIRPAFIFGSIVSLVFFVDAIIRYIPSYFCHILQYRYGCMYAPLGEGQNPSSVLNLQRDTYFKTFPSGLFGKVIWGAVISCILTFSVFGLFLFLFTWNQTKDFSLKILAILIGLLITTILDVLISAKTQGYVWGSGGFYRSRLAFSNIQGMFYEMWNLAIGLGPVGTRIFVILINALRFLGRADTSYMAPQVNFWGWFRDLNHFSFHLDGLMHEAHRHPYIERLAVLYSVKLYNGKNFATREGSAWRLLYVMALFPWLQGYRANKPHLIDHSEHEEEMSNEE